MLPALTQCARSVAVPGAECGGFVNLSDASSVDLESLKQVCEFCLRPNISKWRNKFMCMACFRTKEQAYPTTTPRGLLELLNSSGPAREEFLLLQTRVVSARTSGGRARLPPVVHLERSAERLVSEAPFRWVREADYDDIFGNTPEFNTHGEPVWEQLQPGEWEFGYTIYELDPRLRRVLTQSVTSGTFTQQVDQGTDSGGELRRGQLLESVDAVKAKVAALPTHQERAMAAQRGNLEAVLSGRLAKSGARRGAPGQGSAHGSVAQVVDLDLDGEEDEDGDCAVLAGGCRDVGAGT